MVKKASFRSRTVKWEILEGMRERMVCGFGTTCGFGILPD